MEFEFLVENMTPEDGRKLLNLIVCYVEALGLVMGGGCFPAQAETQGEDHEQEKP